MLALRCGPRLLGLHSGARSAPLRLSAVPVRACSSGDARDPTSSSGNRNPLVYLDVGADGRPLGRVVLEVRPLPRHRPPGKGLGAILGLPGAAARRLVCG